MMYGYGYGMGVWMIIGWIIMAAVLILAVYGLILLLRKSDSGAGELHKTGSPLDVLKERLARGEVSVEEYNRIREELLK